MYIADAGNHVISRVDAGTKHITVYAGDGTGGDTGDGNPATSAELNAPSALVVDPPTGNLYIADSAASVVRLVTAASGYISTVAGTSTACATPTAACGDGGLATAAQLNNPGGLARDSNGDLFIGDSGDNRVRRVDGVSGIITTFAGTGTASYTGDGNAAASATLNTPFQVAVDPAGDVYIADSSNNAVRYVSFVSGNIATIVGNGTACSTTPTPSCGDGGPANVAALIDDRGVVLDAYGNLYVTESGGNRVRKVTTNPAGLPFATETIGSAAPTLDASLYNVGNATLTYTTPVSPNSNALVTTTGPTAASSSAFSQTNATTCGPIYSGSGTTTLASGATCIYVVLFDPDTAAGNYTGTLVETDNSLNSGAGNTIYPTTLTQTLNLTGTATEGTATVSVGSSLSPSLVGRSVTLTATVSGLGVSPTGTVTFTYTPFGSSTPVTLGSPVTLSTSAGVTTAALATSALPLGTDSIVATYNGDTNYLGAPSSALPQVESQQSGTGDTVTAASSSISVGSADQLTFAIPVAAGVSVPTGTVTFTSGATTLASATWPATPSTGTCPPSGPGTCYLLSPTTAPTNIPVGSPTTVTATYAPGAISGYAAPGTAPTTTVTVTLIADTITVTSPTSPDAVIYGSGNVTIAASSTSGQPLTYTSTTLSVCSVTSPGGVVTLLTIGTCTINITQPAAGNYAAATTQTVTINIGAATNTITFPALANTQIGATPPTPAATATSGQPVTYGSTTPSVCTVTSGGVITQVSAGTCILTANQAATGNYAAATQQTQSYQVLQSTQADTLITSNATPTVGASITLTDTVPVVGGAAPTTAPTFYYTPSGSSTPVSLGLGSATATPGVYTLATTALPVGTDSVTANLPAGGNYAAVTSNIVTETVAQSTVPGVLTTSNATPTVGTLVTLTDTIAVINGAAPSIAPTFYYTPSGSSTPVSLGIGTATATPGVFTLATTLLPVGTDSVTANLPAGGNYAASISNIVTETVAQSTVPGVLSTSNATPTVGASVTLTDTIAIINGAAPPVAPTFYYTPSGSSTPVSLGLGTATATPGVFTVTTTALPVGTDSVTANLPAGGNYAASISNIVTETVAQSTTPGVLTTSNATPTVGASVTLTDTITVINSAAPPVAPTFYYTPSGSSTPVSLGLGTATATPGVFTLATTALPVGTDSVTANLPAGGNYAASISNIVTETVAQSTTPGVLTTSNAAPTAGTSITLTDTIAVVGGVAPPVAPTFYYTPSGSSTPVSLGLGTATATPGVFTLATTALPVGTDSVTANLPAGGNYAASTSNTVVETVTALTDTITFPVLPNTAFGSVPPTPAATSTSGQPVTYSTTSTACSVTNAGVITFNSIGSCAITASQAAAGIYAAATPVTQTFTISVEADAIIVTSPVSPDAVLYGSGTVAIAATSTSGQPIVYAATTPTVCSVSSTGVVTILSTGTCIVTLNQPAAGNYAAAAQQTVTLNVSAGVNTITFPALPNTPFGATPPVPAATSTAGGAIAYASTTPTVCTATAAGVITDLTIGTCTITANQAATANYAAAAQQTRSYQITVAPDVITIPPSVPTTTPYSSGGTFPIAATTTSSVTPTYTSTTPTICSVSSTGVVTTLSPGTCTINVSQPAAGNYAAATTVPVTITLTLGINTITFPSLPNTLLNSTPPVPAATATSGQPVTYSTTSTACSVTSAGVITFLTSGTCAITASQSATGNYAAAAPVTQSFSVNLAPAVITGTVPPSAEPGSGTISIGAVSTSNQPITYISTTPSVCTVTTPGGLVTILATGSCSITASQPAGGGYAAGSANFVISVNDFTIAAQAPLTQSVIPGAVATFTYALAPVGTQYPGATVTYTVAGCPPGATCTVNPATVAQGAGPQTLTLTVSTAQAVAINRVRQSAPWSFALLLPFLALRKSRRKLAQTITMCVLLLAAISAVTGCASDYGFFGQPPQTYSITVTATSGGITHTAVAVSLEVE
jgi:hypothetical protein